MLKSNWKSYRNHACVLHWEHTKQIENACNCLPNTLNIGLQTAEKRSQYEYFICDTFSHGKKSLIFDDCCFLFKYIFSEKVWRSSSKWKKQNLYEAALFSWVSMLFLCALDKVLMQSETFCTISPYNHNSLERGALSWKRQVFWLPTGIK